ncbi:MAG: hypothetical protein EHM36_05340 [Deltaproteobacteria bacterium]|nr:MAG: hypothetical protein EHM36_05340 [Deltaproteobacteria bacterium]
MTGVFIFGFVLLMMVGYLVGSIVGYLVGERMKGGEMTTQAVWDSIKRMKERVFTRLFFDVFKRLMTLRTVKAEAYQDSWRKRGHAGVFHNLARKWDRIENCMAAASVGRDVDFSKLPVDGETLPRLLWEIRELLTDPSTVVPFKVRLEGDSEYRKKLLGKVAKLSDVWRALEAGYYPEPLDLSKLPEDAGEDLIETVTDLAVYAVNWLTLFSATHTKEFLAAIERMEGLGAKARAKALAEGDEELLSLLDLSVSNKVVVPKPDPVTQPPQAQGRPENVEHPFGFDLDREDPTDWED